MFCSFIFPLSKVIFHTFAELMNEQTDLDNLKKAIH